MADRKPARFSKNNQFPRDKQIDELKVPPHSLEAEQSVLGGLLLDNETFDRVGERVVAQDFYSRSHRITYETIAALIELGEPVDLITLSEALENDQKLDDAGGFVYLAEMMKNTPSAANITAYADIVRERAVTREMISVANEIAEAGYDPQGRSSADLLDFAETKVFAIAEQRANKSEGPENISSVLEKTVDRIEKLCASPTNGVTGVSSGFTDLDKMTAGFQKSDLIIVAGRPSMGKTTFAMMPSEQLMMRMLASLGRIDQTKIRTGQLEDEDWARLSSTMGLLIEKGKMYIDDAAGLTPTDVRSRARRIARDHGGISLIMIDYLQLMRAPQFSDNRTLEIAEISRSLKALAKELEVPVIALSQLNRGLEQRESGSIEQDADLIMFIYRDEVYHDDSEYKGMAEIIIGKQRNGPIGRVPLTFQGQFSRFDNYAGPHVLDED